MYLTLIFQLAASAQPSLSCMIYIITQLVEKLVRADVDTAVTGQD